MCFHLQLLPFKIFKTTERDWVALKVKYEPHIGSHGGI